MWNSLPHGFSAVNMLLRTKSDSLFNPHINLMICVVETQHILEHMPTICITQITAPPSFLRRVGLGQRIIKKTLQFTSINCWCHWPYDCLRSSNMCGRPFVRCVSNLPTLHSRTWSDQVKDSAQRMLCNATTDLCCLGKYDVQVTVHRDKLL